MAGFFFDIETTGLDATSDRIVELGATVLDGDRVGVPTASDFAESTAWVTKVNPCRPIPPDATRIHGIGDGDVAGSPKFSGIAERMVARIERCEYVAGYNALWFDWPFLAAELQREGVSVPDRPVLDPYVWVKWAHRDWPRRRLVDAVRTYGIQMGRAHSAGADIMATARLTLAMMDAGAIPPDWRERQPHVVEQTDREWEAFRFWLYADRDDDGLRVGCGKHCGARVEDVDPGYFGYIYHCDTSKPAADKMPTAARRIFRALGKRVYDADATRAALESGDYDAIPDGGETSAGAAA